MGHEERPWTDKIADFVENEVIPHLEAFVNRRLADGLSDEELIASLRAFLGTLS